MCAVSCAVVSIHLIIQARNSHCQLYNCAHDLCDALVLLMMMMMLMRFAAIIAVALIVKYVSILE